MKVKKLKICQNKMSLKSCKWASLNVPCTENPSFHSFLGLWKFPFPILRWISQSCLKGFEKEHECLRRRKSSVLAQSVRSEQGPWAMGRSQMEAGESPTCPRPSRPASRSRVSTSLSHCCGVDLRALGYIMRIRQN